MAMGGKGLVLLCAASMAASLFPVVHAETFILQADTPGHEATVRIPGGAITNLSANFAESLSGYADPRDEAIRLSGDVSISIEGSTQPIHIMADSVVLELTPDSAQGPQIGTRADAAAHHWLRSTSPLTGGDDSQVFLGDVEFNLQTPSGPVQIRADRVQHQLQPAEPKPKAGA
jgi:hypothetical protein